LDPENVIEIVINEQRISLFIVPGVPEDYAFKTKTRKEISVSALSGSSCMIVDYFVAQRIEWFKLTDLPTWRRNKSVPGRFYLITPFIGYVFQHKYVSSG
jgi:mRNA-decapping enzyme subunit 2